MKVILFKRPFRNGNFTFENLYSSIYDALINRIEVDLVSIPDSKNMIKLLFFIKKRKKDINHITGDIHYISFFLPSHRTILTIHDIGHYIFKLKNPKKIIYKYFWIILPLKKVKHIHAISEFTKSELVKYAKIDPNKIKVIHNPLNPVFKFSEKKSNSKFQILQIGSGHNKNVEKLVYAVVGLDVKIVFINNALSEHILDILNFYKIDYVKKENLSINQLINEYIEADILYFASIYEGFGMPIIESQAVGRPVITSKIASMPEIAGDAAIFVDPNSILEIRSSIIKLMNDKNFYYELVKKGLRNITRFEMSKIIDEYIDFYKQVIYK
jgi:glycosyltransferase involved in cell wall biosynthesis